MEKKKKITFEKCTLPMIEKEFGLKRIVDSQEVNDWVNVKDYTLNDFELQTLKNVTHHARLRVKSWNEESLKMMFIAPIINLIDFNTNEIGSFADEKLEAEFFFNHRQRAFLEGYFFFLFHSYND